MRGTSLQKALGNRIRTLRNQKGWTLDHLGYVTGLNSKHIGEIERGQVNVTLESLQSLGDGLNTSVADLFVACPGSTPSLVRDSHMTQAPAPGQN